MLIGLLLFACNHGWGQAELTADNMEFSQGSQVATGNAELKDQTRLLRADKISYKGTTANATGNVSFSQKGLRIVGKSLKYNLGDGSFSGSKLRVGKWPVYIEAEELSGSPRLYEARDAIFHYGEPERFSPRIHAGRLGYHPEAERYFVEDARFKLGDYTIFNLPSGNYSTTKYPFDFIGEAGHRKAVGTYAIFEPSLFNGKEFRLKPSIELYEKRGILLNPSIEFLREGDALTQSDLSFSWIRDHSDEPPLYGTTLPDDRYHWKWEHEHMVEGVVHAKVKLSWLSDADFLRDFRPDMFRDDFDDDSFAEASYHRDNFILSTMARLQPNDFSQFPQKLPEIRADLLANPLGQTGFVQRGHAALAWVRDDTADLDNTRFDAYYGISYEWPTASWFSLTPLAGTRLTKYFKNDNYTEDYTRFIGEIGLDAEAFSHAAWDYVNPVWGINGLRHMIKGVVQYRYIPEAQNGVGKLAAIEKRLIEHNMPLLGLGTIPNLDDLGEFHTSRLGIENRLETRSAEYGSRRLAGLNIYQDILPSRNSGKLDALYLNGIFSPARWVDMALTAKMPSRSGKIHRLSSEIILRDGDKMNLHLANEYLLDGNRQNLLFATYQLSRDNLLAAGLRYDAKRNDMTEQSYTWSTTLGKHWIIDNSVTLRKGDLRESNFTYRVGVHLNSF
jgi:LPS-assembly protein